MRVADDSYATARQRLSDAKFRKEQSDLLRIKHLAGLSQLPAVCRHILGVARQKGLLAKLGMHSGYPNLCE